MPKRFDLPFTVFFTHLYCSFHANDLLRRTIPFTQLILRSLHSSFSRGARSKRFLPAMPPKQATLGYVKPSQQTLGCMLPRDYSFMHMLIYQPFTGSSSGNSKTVQSLNHSSRHWPSIPPEPPSLQPTKKTRTMVCRLRGKPR